MSESLWSLQTNQPKFSTLNKDEVADVCIVGAGIAGIATAYLLQKSGLRVIVLEAMELGKGQTARSTAHLSTALSHRYFELEHLHGLEGAKLIADSHTAAINFAEEVTRIENFDCDLKRVDGYLILGEDDAERLLKKEYQSALKAGLKSISLKHSVPGLPYKTGAALCFAEQIQLHPLKFLYGLTEAYLKLGGKIFTHTRVSEIKGGERAYALSDSGHLVQAKSLVVATNTPINDQFAIHTKQSAYRTYAIAAAIPKNSLPEILLWDTEDPYHYVRTQPDADSEAFDLLIVGGEDHKTGQNSDPENAYLKLEAWMRDRFRFAQEIRHRWSGQVMEPVDGIAYLGHNPPDRENVYVITGDAGNGITHALIGAMLINDQIHRKPSPWEVLYQPSRKNLRALGTFVRENANVVAQYGDWVAPADVNSEAEILPGSGAVLRSGTQILAVYKDDAGACHTTSAACPHLGAIVHWNSAEKSWDCPCHGSRFDAYGRVIEGPACSNLKPSFSKPPFTALRFDLEIPKVSF